MVLDIHSRGIIVGGYAAYSIDEAGKVSYQGEVKAKVFFFTKTFPFKGEKKVLALETLRSDFYRTVGATANFELFIVTVLEIIGGGARVCVEIPGYGIGSAVLDLSKPIVSIDSFDIKAKVAGYNVEIVAD